MSFSLTFYGKIKSFRFVFMRINTSSTVYVLKVYSYLLKLSDAAPKIATSFAPAAS